jgi:hypothetical protein
MAQNEDWLAQNFEKSYGTANHGEPLEWQGESHDCARGEQDDGDNEQFYWRMIHIQALACQNAPISDLN